MGSRILFAALILTTATISQAGTVHLPANPIAAFTEVSPEVYRGARPELSGIQYLMHLGIKTDLNLDNDLVSAEEEGRIAAAYGIRMVSIPMSGFYQPTDAEVNAALGVLADEKNYPIYVHCLHGEDRTGLIIGLFRIEVQGWSKNAAWQEMLRHGFHDEMLFPLTWYFDARTRLVN